MPCSASAARWSAPVAPRQQPAMDRRVQRLDPAVEHLGKAGDRGDLGHREPGLGEVRAVPPVETSATPRPASAPANGTSPALVADRDQRAADRARRGAFMAAATPRSAAAGYRARGRRVKLRRARRAAPAMPPRRRPRRRAPATPQPFSAAQPQPISTSRRRSPAAPPRHGRARAAPRADRNARDAPATPARRARGAAAR